MSHYSDKEHIFPLQGGCPCGQTRYILTLPPILVHACHCLACQRQTGSSHALNAIVETDALKFLAGPGNESSRVSGSHPIFASTTQAHASSTPKFENGSQELSRTWVPTASGTGQTLVSCSLCRVPLWNHYAGAGPCTAFLRVGTLDSPWEISPDVHIYTKYKRSYMQLADGKPYFEEYYESRSAFYREGVLERVRALDQKVSTYKDDIRKAQECIKIEQS